MSEKLYKVLGENGEAYYGGIGKWFLPKGKRTGKWMPEIKRVLEPCANGYHLCRKRDLVGWLGPTIYEAEYRGECVKDTDKIVVRKARLIRKMDAWTDRTARLFACDCAERSLRKYSGTSDPCSLETIRVARRFANGEATGEELAVAWDAAKAEARAVAWDAAKAEAWAAARKAAWEAAGAAAWAAARAAAREAAGAAAREAAGAAARAAAWAAAREAAWEAARDAARDAAMNAERKWQTKRLFEYLDGERP